MRDAPIASTDNITPSSNVSVGFQEAMENLPNMERGQEEEWSVDPRFPDLDVLGQKIASEAMRNPRIIGTIPEQLQAYLDWYREVVCACLREKYIEMHQHNSNPRYDHTPFDQAKREFESMFHAATVFVCDADVRRAAHLKPIDDPEQADIIKRLMRSHPPEPALEGSPLETGKAEVYTEPAWHREAGNCDVCGNREIIEGTVTLEVSGIPTLRSIVGSCRSDVFESVQKPEILKVLYQGKLIANAGVKLSA